MTMSTNREAKKKRSLCWDLFSTLKVKKILQQNSSAAKKEKIRWSWLWI